MNFRISGSHGRCIVCKKHTVKRIHRSRLMRLFPGSKSLKCTDCGMREYVLFNYFSIILKAKKRPKKKSGLYNRIYH